MFKGIWVNLSQLLQSCCLYHSAPPDKSGGYYWVTPTVYDVTLLYLKQLPLF